MNKDEIINKVKTFDYKKCFFEALDNAKVIIKTKYRSFQGTADPKEFWLWFLLVFVVNFILVLLPFIGCYLSALFLLATICPSLGVCMRRFRGLGQIDWKQLNSTTYMAAFIILIAIVCVFNCFNSVTRCFACGSCSAQASASVSCSSTNSNALCNEVKQSEVKQSEVKQSEVKQSEVKQSEVKQSEVKQSEVKAPVQAKSDKKVPLPAANAIYKGAEANEKNIICYYHGGKFYADAACKNLMYSHPGNMVSKEAAATPNNAIYRLVGGRIYKGFSLDKKDCLVTFVETKTKKGDVVDGKIYEGFAVPRDVETETPEPGIEIKKSFVITKDGLPPSASNTPVKVLFTVKDGKLYRGESTETKDCVLSYTGTMNNSRLMFMAVELVK